MKILKEMDLVKKKLEFFEKKSTRYYYIFNDNIITTALTANLVKIVGVKK
jgi:hypothetical protein